MNETPFIYKFGEKLKSQKDFNNSKSSIVMGTATGTQTKEGLDQDVSHNSFRLVLCESNG